MITLTFKKNRNNAESFVAQVIRVLSASPCDFVRAKEHGITKVELKSDNLNLSSDTDEIFYKDIPVYHERQNFIATEFTIKPTQESLSKITDKISMELVVNDNEHIGFIEIKLK